MSLYCVIGVYCHSEICQLYHSYHLLGKKSKIDWKQTEQWNAICWVDGCSLL
jgi:hypothetical protein